jgi:hypothetical protein
MPLTWRSAWNRRMVTAPDRVLLTRPRARITAASRQDKETLTLRSDKKNSSQLADEIMARLRN